MELPWSCEQSFRVSQGHNTGSHTGNGAWAWDFNLREGELVTAPADGTIRMVRDDSTRHGCGSAYAWDANYVIVDFGDGTEALFLHMKAGTARVTPGQSVRRGEPLAEVGNSGWVCGTHLHFQFQKTCSSWWCPSIPASFTEAGDPDRGITLASNNCPSSASCLVEASGPQRVDERDECYRRTPGSWWEEPGDNGARFDLTLTTGAEDKAPAIGTWHLDIAQAGRYQIEAHIPAGAEATQARYYIRGADGVMLAVATIDQSASTGWTPLGVFDLPADAATIELPANTGELPDARRLVYDGLRLTHVGEPELVAQPSPAPVDTAHRPLPDDAAQPTPEPAPPLDEPAQGGVPTLDTRHLDSAAEESAEPTGCSATGGRGQIPGLLLVGLMVGCARLTRRLKG